MNAGQMTKDARDAEWARLIPTLDPMGFTGAEAVILTTAERPLAVDFARGLSPDIVVLVEGGVPEGAARDVMGLVLAPQNLAEIAISDGMTPSTIATGLGLVRKLGWRPVKVGAQGRGPGIGAQVLAAARRAAQVLVAAGVPLAQVTRAVAAVVRLPAGLAEGQGALMAMQDAAIADRVLAAMANEGARLVSQGRVLCPADIDVILVGGFGFPRALGGPMHLADARGLIVLRRNLRIWAVEDAVWQPDALFDSLIADGRNFAALNQAN